MKSPRSIAIKLLAVPATGLLIMLALPLGEQSYLIWFALVPLLLATRGRGFLYGFLGSLAALLLAASVTASGYDPWTLTGYGTFGISFALAYGVWADPGSRKMPAWWFAALATLLEAVLLVKLPAHLALSQYRNAFFVQLASIGGIWMVSFLIWWANFALANCLQGDRNPRRIAVIVAP